LPRAQATFSRVEYVPEFGRAVRIAEFDRPMSSDDEETAQTVTYMDELAARDARDPAVIDAAREALDDAGIDETAPDIAKAQAVYWWLKRTVRYVNTPGTSPLVDQTLITPCAVLAMPEPIGDCPQFSMLAAAMFRVLCIRCLYVTIAAEPLFPDQWSHIYNTVEVYPGKWLPFDSSNGPAPGAEYAQPFKRRVWPQLTPGKCSTSKEGPQLMMRSQSAAPSAGMRNRTLRGALGDLTCDQDGNCYEDGTNVTGGLTLSEIQAAATQGDCAYGANAAGDCLSAPINTPSNSPSPGNSATISFPGGTGSAPSSSSPFGFLTTLTNDLAQIAAPAVKAATGQPYLITNAQGQQVLYNPATGAIAQASATLSPSVLLIGLGVALFAFASSSKGK
jgi:hypothetical protein